MHPTSVPASQQAAGGASPADGDGDDEDSAELEVAEEVEEAAARSVETGGLPWAESALRAARDALAEDGADHLRLYSFRAVPQQASL